MSTTFITGHARPTAALRARLAVPAIDPATKRLVEREDAIDALSRLLTEAIETRQAKDGRIDMRDVAAHVLAEMGRHQK